jgi:hypothetical protein
VRAASTSVCNSPAVLALNRGSDPQPANASTASAMIHRLDTARIMPAPGARARRFERAAHDSSHLTLASSGWVRVADLNGQEALIGDLLYAAQSVDLGARRTR